ncbi:MAG: hypothetical protein NTZ14_16525 [Hyphomicrobiales bacterium]|nr:hypothetical protein [Hyphomicrobiales bacterium]
MDSEHGDREPHARFRIEAADDAALDPALRQLAEHYVEIANGDLLLALMLAVEDVLTLKAVASRGLLSRRQLNAD